MLGQIQAFSAKAHRTPSSQTFTIPGTAFCREPAGAHAVEVVAMRLAAVAIEVNPDRATAPAALTAGALVRERREVRLLDGRGGHARAYHDGDVTGWGLIDGQAQGPTPGCVRSSP
jgi:hypothetical protein